MRQLFSFIFANYLLRPNVLQTNLISAKCFPPQIKTKYSTNVEENKDLNKIDKTDDNIKMVEPKGEIVDTKEEAEIKATVTK